MTIFNRQDFLAEAIESVLSSTYENWELILVDDQSQDHSVSIAREYEKKDPRIRLYINEKNLGDYPNRNKASSYARGKYIKYLDSDDLIYPESLSTLVGFMEEYPEAAIGLEVEEKHLMGLPCRLLSGPDVLRQSFLHKAFMLCGPTGTILRRDIFEQMKGFGGNTFVGTDTIFYLRIALDHDILVFNKGYMYYREHEQQEYLLRKKDYYIRFFDEFRTIITHPRSPLNPAEKKQALLKLRNLYIGQTWNFFKRLKFRFAYYTFFRSGFCRTLFFIR
jgi:glycosyltransferase involved in cell wall biosynthesis